MTETTVLDLQQAMNSGQTSSQALVSTCLERIESLNGRLRAILCVNPDAHKMAHAMDRERKQKGPRSPLHGIPVIVKDSITTRDNMPTTAGTRALESFKSSKDAFLIAKLRQAGAIILAKSNLHELSYGFATQSTLGGQTLNPYTLDRQPGGSSGGTAVAITTGMGAVGIGEDTAGSIRVPAAFNSIVGIRPTVGLISRIGLVPLAPSRDTAGPMTRTVTDAAILLDAMAGYDPADPMTASNVGKIPKTYTAFLKKNGLRRTRIGVMRAFISVETESATAVSAVIDAAIQQMRSLGATIVDPVEILPLDDINNRDKYAFEATVEWRPAFHNFLKWAGQDAPIRSFADLAESVKGNAIVERVVVQSLQAAEAEEDISYLRTIAIAQKHAELGVLQAMAEHNLDALVYPAVMEPPAKIGERQTGTATTNLAARARFPSIVVPAGFANQGLPVGIEFLARAFEEPRLIQMAYAFEQGTGYRRPPNLLI